MKLRNSLKLLSVFACIVFLLPTALSFAAETKIEGMILESAGDRVKIEYQSDYMPNIGDPVEIGFKAKSEFIPLKGQWKIVKADSQFVWAKAQGRTEEPPVDYLAIIHSSNPRKKAKEGQLFIKSEPVKTRIRILNIEPKFYQGMELKPGGYHVEVSKPGYRTKKMWVNLGAGEDKEVVVKLERLQASLQPTTTHTPHPSSTPNVVKRDGIYVACANGIVKDTRTGLEWKAGPDRDMNWTEARSWVQSLGGDWRMPTTDELEGLYNKGKGSRNMTPLLKTTDWWIWSGETKASSDAWHFDFEWGSRRWSNRYNTIIRAFAVRSQ